MMALREPVAERTDAALHVMPGGASAEPRTVVIEPSRGFVRLGLGDLWQYRDLLYILAWRDVKVRYKQTVLGAGWAIVQPVFNMLIFTFIFGRVAHLPSDGVPYALFTLAALLPWTYFSYVLMQSGESLVENARMITKVYFPRLVLPISAALAGLIDLGISFVLLIGMMLFFHVQPGLGLLLLPFFLLLSVATALSVGIWLSALNVRYRDVRYTLPFLSQVLLYLSPVAYSAGLVKGHLAVLYMLNPMVGVIDGFRWALLGRGNLPWLPVLFSMVTTSLILTSGLVYFRRMEQTFADLV
ncbi:MAG TPA: ABC transporter permease [Chloroflexota bacterium]|nr:ABC transporter permease [Chloroflexota bacterium]